MRAASDIIVGRLRADIKRRLIPLNGKSLTREGLDVGDSGLHLLYANQFIPILSSWPSPHAEA